MTATTPASTLFVTADAPGTTVRSARGRARQATSDAPPVPGRPRLRRVSSVLLAIGLAVVGMLVYLFVFTDLEAARNQRVLLAAFDTPAGQAALTGRVPAEGRPAAILEIPAIGLRQAVIMGTSAGDLEWGPGLMPDTAFPGTVGNAVIAGHRLTWGHPFAHLDQLQPGDRITVVTGEGPFTYRVTAIGTAVPGVTDPISPSAHAELTLVTSNPEYVPSGRLYVRAVLAGRTPLATDARTVATSRPPVSERGLAGDGGAVVPAVLTALVLAACLWATVVVYRRYDQWSVHLVCMPVLLAAAVWFFSYLAALLPPTI